MGNTCLTNKLKTLAVTHKTPHSFLDEEEVNNQGAEGLSPITQQPYCVSLTNSSFP